MESLLIIIFGIFFVILTASKADYWIKVSAFLMNVLLLVYQLNDDARKKQLISHVDGLITFFSSNEKVIITIVSLISIILVPYYIMAKILRG